MKVKRIDQTFFPHFKVEPSSHPLLKLTTATKRYGIIDRNVNSNIWIGFSEIIPAYVNPGFEIIDKNVTEITVDMKLGETLMWSLDGNKF